MTYRIYDLITNETIGETNSYSEACRIRDAYNLYFQDSLAAAIETRKKL